MKKNLHIKGFTIIELMVSVGIFALMTTFLLAKYGTFNQSILLTNLAYDVALTIRSAQSYGLNVKSIPGANTNFSVGYGVNFSKGASSFIFFADADANLIYTSNNNEEIGSPYGIKRGSKISDLCVGADAAHCTTVTTLDVSFKRPDPDAIIIADSTMSAKYAYAEITLQSTDGSIKKVVVRSTGQIAIIN